MLRKWIPVLLLVLVAGGVAAYVITGNQGDEKKQGKKTAKQGEKSGNPKTDRGKVETGDVDVDASYEEKYEVNGSVSGGKITTGDVDAEAPDQPRATSQPDSPDEPDQPEVEQPSQPQVQQPETPQQPQVQTPSGPG